MLGKFRDASFRLGVLGGTFNPIHYGHLHIARAVRKIFALSEVRFVVSAQPPHKSPEDLIPLMHRYAMVCLATIGEPAFVPSLVELEPEASSFSIDTLDKLGREIEPMNGVLYFIAGGDSLLEVKSWRDSEILLQSYNFVFVLRPGINSVDPAAALPANVVPRLCDLTKVGGSGLRKQLQLQEPEKNHIYIVDVGAPDISATRIRQCASAGKSIRKMVPEPVREYIHKLHLYGGK